MLAQLLGTVVGVAIGWALVLAAALYLLSFPQVMDAARLFLHTLFMLTGA